MKTVIIDNEATVIQWLQIALSENCPQVVVCATANSVKTGIEAIKEHTPDLIFLDIEMDDGFGFDIIDALALPPKVVFITAHSHYALKAIKASALDYLLKPIAPKELVLAVEKAQTQSVIPDFSNNDIKGLLRDLLHIDSTIKRIVLRDYERVFVVQVEDIIRCEADGKYTRFKLQKDPDILVSKNLKTYEDLLGNSGFIRCHHSHLVRIQGIKYFSKNLLELNLSNGETIPVSTRKKEIVVAALEALGKG